MNALLFPGQGSQLVGMGQEFFDNFKSVKDIFKEADDKLNYSISKIILKGPEDQLQLTQNTQPAILVVSYSIFMIMKKEFGINLNSFKYFAGHSLGEYSALVCSGSLSFNDALYLLHERGKAMQAAVPVGRGKMIAVLGLNPEEIKNLISQKIDEQGICEIANDNANGQVIVSGDKESVNTFEIFLKEKKVKSIPLKVSAPFHCSLMRPAAESMQEKILGTDFNNATTKIVNNVTAKAEDDAAEVKKLLIEQIFSTVRWRESLIYMNNNSIKNFIEIGPGKVLTGMVKRTIKDSNCFSINTIADIKNLENELK